MININFTKWLALVKLFDLGTSARHADREADVRYPTALHFFDCIRYSILYHLAESDKKLKGKLRLTRCILKVKEREIEVEMLKTKLLCLTYWKEKEKFTLRLSPM